jgi:hypothetical protein
MVSIHLLNHKRFSPASNVTKCGGIKGGIKGVRELKVSGAFFASPPPIVLHPQGIIIEHIAPLARKEARLAHLNL